MVIGLRPVITKQYNSRIHTSTKLTPIQAFFKENKGFFLQEFIRQTEENKS